MKIIEVIEKVDALYPNSYKTAEKIAWCDELGEMLKREYAKSYSGNVQQEYEKISDPMEAETVVPPPYDAMYVDYVLAKCCYYQRDYETYNQHIVLFDSRLDDFSKWYIERNMPVRDTENKLKGWW